MPKGTPQHSNSTAAESTSNRTPPPAQLELRTQPRGMQGTPVRGTRRTPRQDWHRVCRLWAWVWGGRGVNVQLRHSLTVITQHWSCRVGCAGVVLVNRQRRFTRGTSGGAKRGGGRGGGRREAVAARQCLRSKRWGGRRCWETLTQRWR